MKPSKSQIDQFLAHQHIAMAGYSHNPKKFGHEVFRTLTEKGYDIEAVNPKGGRVNGSGKEVFTHVDQLPDDLNALLVVTKKDQSLKIVQDARKKGIAHIWVQQMSACPDLKAMAANDPGIIIGQCIMMHAKPSGIHKFHHFLSGLFGLLPR
ncbi:MAG: CoA-binding protein [Marinilabilia sp.]